MKKSLYLLLLLLFPIRLQAQSEVIVLHPDEGKAEVNEAEYTRIFLAGTIDMGKSIDWQKATCNWFRARPQGKYILYNPRRDKELSGKISDFEHQSELGTGTSGKSRPNNHQYPGKQQVPHHPAGDGTAHAFG